jgi:hypothetical protein
VSIGGCNSLEPIVRIRVSPQGSNLLERFTRLASCIQCRRSITSMRIAVLLFVIVLSELVSYIGRGIAEIVFR